MGKSHKSALLEIELSFAVDVSLIDVYADYFGKEHGMRAKKLFVSDLTFKAERALLNKGRSDLLRRDGVEAAGAELVRISAAFDAAEVGLTAHGRCGKVYDELSRLLYDVVGVTLGTD